MAEVSQVGHRTICATARFRPVGLARGGGPGRHAPSTDFGRLSTGRPAGPSSPPRRWPAAPPSGRRPVPVVRLGGGRRDDLVALDLGLDQRLQRLAVLVGVLRRVEVAGQRRRSGLAPSSPPRASRRRPRRGTPKSGVADLVRPQHRLQHQHAVAHAQHGQRLALAQRDLDDRDPAGRLAAPRAAGRTASRRSCSGSR